MKESALQSKIIKKLRDKYGELIDITNNHGSAMSAAGTPDLHICFCGIFITMEIKLPDRVDNGVTKKQTEPTALQNKRLIKLTNARAIAAVIRSAEDALAVIEIVNDNYNISGIDRDQQHVRRILKSFKIPVY